MEVLFNPTIKIKYEVETFSETRCSVYCSVKGNKNISPTNIAK